MTPLNWPTPKNITLQPKIMVLSYTQPELWWFKPLH